MIEIHHKKINNNIEKKNFRHCEILWNIELNDKVALKFRTHNMFLLCTHHLNKTNDRNEMKRTVFSATKQCVIWKWIGLWIHYSISGAINKKRYINAVPVIWFAHYSFFFTSFMVISFAFWSWEWGNRKMYLKYKLENPKIIQKSSLGRLFLRKWMKRRKKQHAKPKNWTKFVFVGAAVTQMWIIQSNLFI